MVCGQRIRMPFYCLFFILFVQIGMCFVPPCPMLAGVHFSLRLAREAKGYAVRWSVVTSGVGHRSGSMREEGKRAA
jgi:hypothetical protein